MKIRLLVTLVIAFLTTSAFAWNNLGHKLVAEIAWYQLDPATRQLIVEILRRHSRFDKDFEPKMEDAAQVGNKEVQYHWIFQHAATWPDLVRSLKGKEEKTYNKPTWHYINLPIYLHPADKLVLFPKLRLNLSTKYTSWAPKDQFNVLQAIAYCRQTIASKAGAEDKAIAYCWLFHLVGDIHQPLHTTALFSVERFPDGDKGGNEIPLARSRKESARSMGQSTRSPVLHAKCC